MSQPKPTTPSTNLLLAKNEEIANVISHGCGFLGGLSAIPLLIQSGMESESTISLVGNLVFGITGCLLYLCSTLYHAFPPGPLKRTFRLFDHCAIYLFIAGSYTPFTLGILGGVWGWSLIGLVWCLAIVGIGLKVFSFNRHSKLSLVLYIGMGWTVLIAIRPLWLLMPKIGLLWIAAGGVAYTSGIIFYKAKQLAYNHLIWHLFVMVGSACHLVAVLNYST